MTSDPKTPLQQWRAFHLEDKTTVDWALRAWMEASVQRFQPWTIRASLSQESFERWHVAIEYHEGRIVLELSSNPAHPMFVGNLWIGDLDWRLGRILLHKAFHQARDMRPDADLQYNSSLSDAPRPCGADFIELGSRTLASVRYEDALPVAHPLVGPPFRPLEAGPGTFARVLCKLVDGA